MDLLITIVVSALILGLMFLYFKRQIRQATSAATFLKDVQEEVDEMVKELNLSAERNIALLEDRIATLETLLSNADQKIVMLNRELEKKEKTAGVYSHLKKAAPEILTKQNELAIEDPVVSGEKKPEVQVEQTPPVVAPAPSEKPKPLKERVLELARFGMPAAEIAAKTGATLGEVELIVLLHSPRTEPVSPS